MLFNFSFYVVYFLGNEKSKKAFMHSINILLPSLSIFTIGINEPKTVHRIVLLYYPALFGSLKILDRL